MCTLFLQKELCTLILQKKLCTLICSKSETRKQDDNGGGGKTWTYEAAQLTRSLKNKVGVVVVVVVVVVVDFAKTRGPFDNK